MKRITFLALAMCLTFGLMAQEFLKPAGKRVNFTPVEKGLIFKTVGSTISDVTFGTEVMSTNSTTGEYMGIPTTFTVTLNNDATRFYVSVYAANTLQNFIDTSTTYSSMAEYMLAEAKYYNMMYAYYGYDYDAFDSVSGSMTYSGFWGNGNYEIYVLTINSDTTETQVDTYTFTTPSSSKNGVATVNVSKTDDVSVGEIDWNITTNNTRQFYFFCDENSADGARYFIENYNMPEDSGYMYYLSAYASNYENYFVFDWDADVNNVWTSNPFVEDGQYVEGTEYVYGALPFNGNGDMGTFTYATFTFGVASLNDVVEFTNNLRVYPNPARETVSINSTLSMNKVELYNTLGQLVYSENVNSNSVNLPVSNLNNGTYIVKAYADGVVVNTKVVVE